MALRTVEINVSKELVRDPQEPGHLVGKLKESIGNVRTVPQIAFYNEGEVTFFRINSGEPFSGRSSSNILKWTEAMMAYYDVMDHGDIKKNSIHLAFSAVAAAGAIASTVF